MDCQKEQNGELVHLGPDKLQQMGSGPVLLRAEPLLHSAYWKSRGTKALSKATAAFPLVLSWSKMG